MSFNEYKINLSIEVVGIGSISVTENGSTYNSTQDQIRLDLDNATSNVLKILDKINKKEVEA